jgi:hypothetical protein
MVPVLLGSARPGGDAGSSFLAGARIVNKGRAPMGRICLSQGDNAIQITSILPDGGDYSAIL